MTRKMKSQNRHPVFPNLGFPLFLVIQSNIFWQLKIVNTKKIALQLIRVHIRKLLVFSLCVLLLASCRGESGKVMLSINGRPLEVEIAKTRKQREKGLMFREELGWNEGMIFIFPEDQYLSFWMKDTSIPLSIAFLDERGVVVNILDMKPFSLDPVRSTGKCRYAIEANRGFFRDAGVRDGDSIDLDVVKRR